MRKRETFKEILTKVEKATNKKYDEDKSAKTKKRK